MPRKLSRQERDRFLGGRRVAVLITISADGRPIPTPIWYRYREGAFYFRTAGNAAKTENVRRDPRVSVCVQDERPPYRAVVAHGTAEVLHGQDWLDREIPRHYLGFVGAMGYERTARSEIEGGRDDVALVVRPQRFVTWDYGPETPLVGRLWLLVKRVLPPWL